MHGSADDDSWDGHNVQSLILVTVGPLSLLGSLFIMATWASFKALRTPSTLMLACLALSDFVCASGTCSVSTASVPELTSASPESPRRCGQVCVHRRHVPRRQRCGR